MLCLGVFHFLPNCFRNLGRDMKIRHPTFDKSLSPQVRNRPRINLQSLLHTVQQTDIIQLQVGTLDQQTAVRRIDDMSVDGRLDEIGPKLVIRHGKIPLALLDIEAMYAVALRINHVDLTHGHDQLEIPVMRRRLRPSDILLRTPLEKTAAVLEDEPIDVFRHHDTSIHPVILMCDAVVQRLEDAVGDVLRHFLRHQFVHRQNLHLDIAHLGIQLRSRQEERRIEDRIPLFLAHQLPHELRGMRRQQVGRQFLADQQQCRPGDPSIAREPRPVEECPEVPSLDLILGVARDVLLVEACPCLGNRPFVQIVVGRTLDGYRRPIVFHRFAADHVQLVETERDKTLTRPRIVMSLPGDRHPARCCGNLQKKHPPVGMTKLVDVDQRDTRVGPLGDLHLQPLWTIQPPGFLAELAFLHLPRLVDHPQHQPRPFLSPQIRLIRQRREILADIVERITRTRFLEFDDLALPFGDKPIQ